MVLAWELLYRLEPGLYDRLASAERLHPGIVGWLPRDVDRIAEVGAGTGRLTMELIERGQRVVAVEPALPLRRILRRKLAAAGHGDRVRVIRGFFDQLPLPDDFADLVVACSAFTPSPGHGGEAGLAEMERVCRPGGCVAIIWPNHLDWLAARGYRYVSFPGPMSVEFGSYHEAVELAEIFYPEAADEVRRRGSPQRPLRGAGHQSAARPGLQGAGGMKIAIMAPLVTAIREPQRGGSQAFVSDLARGLAGRGHDVHVYAASGSQIPGVEVIDTGIDPRSLAGTLYRAFGPAADGPGQPGPAAGPAAAAAESAFTAAYTAMRANRYDVIHNHAFDAPAVRLATALQAPVVHTLHLPPDEAVSAALRHVAGRGRPPAVAAVSGFQASAWRRVVPVDAILPPYPPTGAIPWSRTRRAGRAVRGPAEPGEGRGRGHRHRPRGWTADRRLRRRLRSWVQPGADRPAAKLARGDRSPGSTPGLAVGGHGPGGRGVVPGPLGRALRDGRRRGAGVRDSRCRVPARRTQ